MHDLESRVLKEMQPFLDEELGNPSSLHKPGRRAHDAIQLARGRLAQLIGFEPEHIFFAPNILLANNVAILGRARSVEANDGLKSFLVAHAGTGGVQETLASLPRRGWTVESVDVADLSWQQQLAAGRDAGACTHVDASTFDPVELHKLVAASADTVAFAGASLYAPLVISALAVRALTNIMPVIFGGGQEFGLFPGTEGVANIVALGAAAAVWLEKRVK